MRLVRSGRLAWAERAAPEPVDPGDALVRPFLAGRCDGDTLPIHRPVSRALQAGMALGLIDPVVGRICGTVPFRGPLAIGHESVGQVTAVGPDVTRVRVGQTVVVPWAVAPRASACTRRAWPPRTAPPWSTTSTTTPHGGVSPSPSGHAPFVAPIAERALAPGGICTAVGYYLAVGTRLPVMRMYATDATLRVGVSHARATLPDLLEFLRRTAFPAEHVTTLTADWEDAPTAYAARTTKLVLARDPLRPA